MKFISSAQKTLKTKKKKALSGSKEKNSKKRKVVFHMNKKAHVFVEQLEENEELDTSQELYNNQDDQCQRREELIIENLGKTDSFDYNKAGLIKKVEIIDQKPTNPYESIDTSDHQKEDSYDDYIMSSLTKNDKNLEKLDIINSAKLSELLSSKKKDRYREHEQLIEEIEEEHINHQINFYDESQNEINVEDYEESNSRISVINDSAELEEGEDYDDTESQNSVIQNQDAASESQNEQLNKNESMPTLNNELESPVENFEDPRYNLYDEFNMHQDKHPVIQSMTFSQQRNEQNDIIAESEHDKLTVINCTQSNIHTDEEGTTDRNIIADEFSLEMQDNKQFTGSSEEVPQISTRLNHQQNLSKNYEQNITESYMDEDHHDSSRLEHDESYDEDDLYTSDADYQGEHLIKEISEDDLYQSESDHGRHKNKNEKQYFNHTLTNMRIAF
jgi:hypothetical protein